MKTRFYFLIRLDLGWIWSLSKFFFSEISCDMAYTSAQSAIKLFLLSWVERQSAICELLRHGGEEINISLFRMFNFVFRQISFY